MGRGNNVERTGEPCRVGSDERNRDAPKAPETTHSISVVASVRPMLHSSEPHADVSLAW